MNLINQFKGRWEPLISAASLLAGVALVVAGCSNPPAPAAPKKTDEKAKAAQSSTNNVIAVETKAVFDDDPKTTKDPFFPKSMRRFAKAANGKASAQVPRMSELRLKGVIGSPGRYIAMINDKTFAEGDKTQVSVGPNQNLVVKVNQITARSVIVIVDGEAAPRELTLGVTKEARK